MSTVEDQNLVGLLAMVFGQTSDEHRRMASADEEMASADEEMADAMEAFGGGNGFGETDVGEEMVVGEEMSVAAEEMSVAAEEMSVAAE